MQEVLKSTHANENLYDNPLMKLFNLKEENDNVFLKVYIFCYIMHYLEVFQDGMKTTLGEDQATVTSVDKLWPGLSNLSHKDAEGSPCPMNIKDTFSFMMAQIKLVLSEEEE